MATALCALAAAGCGGGGDDGRSTGPIAWKGEPEAFRSQAHSGDRVLVGMVENDSLEPVRLDASKLEVRDSGGKVLRSNGQYIPTFAHGLYGGFQKPRRLPADELRRLGLVISLEPGATAPLSLAWRLEPGSGEPAVVDYGRGTLVLPAAVKAAR